MVEEVPVLLNNSPIKYSSQSPDFIWFLRVNNSTQRSSGTENPKTENGAGCRVKLTTLH